MRARNGAGRCGSATSSGGPPVAPRGMRGTCGRALWRASRPAPHFLVVAQRPRAPAAARPPPLAFTAPLHPSVDLCTPPRAGSASPEPGCRPRAGLAAERAPSCCRRGVGSAVSSQPHITAPRSAGLEPAPPSRHPQLLGPMRLLVLLATISAAWALPYWPGARSLQDEPGRWQLVANAARGGGAAVADRCPAGRTPASGAPEGGGTAAAAARCQLLTRAPFRCVPPQRRRSSMCALQVRAAGILQRAGNWPAAACAIGVGAAPCLRLSRMPC